MNITFSGPGGIFQVLKIAMPLILASAGHAINLFTDRMMLQWYSSEAMAAAMPSGLTSFALSCFFIGTVGYANSFVAQYVGAGAEKRVGTAVWQALHLSLIGGVFMVFAALFAEEIFDFFGHDPNLRPLEVSYFRILSNGTIIALASVAFATFWGGRGKTFVIMIDNLLITLLNFPLNYLFIFGWKTSLFTIPEMGIEGAALGTLLSGFIGMLLYMVLFFGIRENRVRFNTCGGIFDFELFRRLFRFGAPNGIQLFLDITAFNAFIILLGKINKDVLTASTVAFSMNALAFIPMIGVGQTVSILVGQGVGANDIGEAEKSVRSARVLIIGYMTLMACLFVFYPEPVFQMFRIKPGTVMDMTRTMLCLIAAYLLFDGFQILYGSAIKGAGDTKFAMWGSAAMAWVLYAVPCFVCYLIFSSERAVRALGRETAERCNVWSLWGICVFYIMCCGVVFYLRYRTGKWKKMKVIENVDHPRGAIPKETGVDAFLP